MKAPRPSTSKTEYAISSPMLATNWEKHHLTIKKGNSRLHPSYGPMTMANIEKKSTNSHQSERFKKDAYEFPFRNEKGGKSGLQP